MKSIYFLLLICWVAVASPNFNYKLSSGTKRKLEESKPNITSMDWQPLRIHYEFLQEFNKDYMDFLNKVFDITSTYFQRYLLVRRTDGPITYKSNYPTNFWEFPISSDLRAKSYDADLVIFVNVENSYFEDYLAYCGPTIFDETTLRPIMGLMSWNMFYTNLNSMTDSDFESNVEIAIHETIHGLGFVDDYFNTFYDSVNGEPYEIGSSFQSQGVTYLNTPRITTFGQYHFNCSTMTGIPMEDDGGSGTAGSHFERNLFYNEIMTGSDMTGNFVITDFTFQFLQDTGFYRISDYSPDKSLWGKNEGCSFVEEQCDGGNFSEFCTGYIDGCSFNRGGQSTCKSDFLGGYCKHQTIYNYYDCRDASNNGYGPDATTFQYFGSDSMCVSGSFAKSDTSLQSYSCYKYSCDSNNNLTLYIDGQTIDCSKAGSVTAPETYFSNLECPTDAVTFCQNIDECPNQCNQKGFCQNKQCVCMSGYSGKGCTDTCTDYRYKDQCLTQCPDQTYALEGIKYCVGCPGNCESCTSFNNCNTCKKGYQLRGGFCDNYYLLTQQDNTTNSTITETATTNDNIDTNTTTINSNTTTIDTNSTAVDTTTIDTNSTAVNTTTIDTAVDTTSTNTTIIDTNNTTTNDTTIETNITSNTTLETNTTEINENNTTIDTNTEDTNDSQATNSTIDIETNSTVQINEPSSNTTKQEDSVSYRQTKLDLILINSVLILLNM